MRCQKQQRKERCFSRIPGSLTIFAALTITALLTLFFVLLGGVRQSGTRMRLENVTHIAADSVLAEFEPELHRRYDLFLIDTGYRKGNGSVQKVQNRLLYYLSENCRKRGGSLLGNSVEMNRLSITSAQITAIRGACDQDCRAVREQVYAYMTADPAGTLLGSILPEGEVFKNLEQNGRVCEEQMDENEAELRQAFERAREQAAEQVSEQGEEQSAAEEALSEGMQESEKMTEEISSFRALPLLRQLFRDPSRIPDKAIRGTSLLSRRAVQTGDGLSVRNSHGYPCANGLIFTLYIGEKCRSFADGSAESPLDCEQEYILCGKSSDAENLEHTAYRLLLIREGANCLCLFADEGRRAQAEFVAGAASLLLFNPELKEPLTTALLFGWAYVESLQDLRILLSGGRVPLRKTAAEWQTSLRDLLTPWREIHFEGKGHGLSYEQYLEGLICMESTSERTRRTMDIMELNIRAQRGNSTFRLDECIDSMRILVKGTGRGGYACEIQTEVGYD